MTYSRSRTQNQKKSKRRSRTRLLIIVNGILLTGIVIAAVLAWNSMGNLGGQGINKGKPEAQSVSMPEGGQPSTIAPESTDESEVFPTRDEETPTPTPSEEGDSVLLALVGDILPAARVLDLMKRNGYDYPYREALAVLQAADITAGNLESAITTRGTPAKDKKYLFRGPPEALQGIKDAGFDFLSLANNHTFDYGWEGLSDTMDFLDDADLQHAGSGNDDREAFAPSYVESKGMTVAFVSLTHVVPEVSWKAERNHPGLAETYNPTRALAAIEEAEQNSDLVVVLVHWGEERAEQPLKSQTSLAHSYIDAGADLIIGSHPHVLQGFEAYKGKWIAYSLGNFVFTTTDSSKTSETGVLNAECGKDGNCSLKFQPMFATNSQPAPMEATASKELLARLSALSYGASVKEDGTIVAQN